MADEVKGRKKYESHGDKHSRLYITWGSMRARVLNPQNKSYKRYGGKGIKICKEWDSFLNFKNWALNNGYNDKLTIERINPKGDYEPSNCEWITLEENSSRTTTRSYLKYTCKKGHPWTPATTYHYVYKNRKDKLMNGKTCKICINANQRRKWARKRLGLSTLNSRQTKWTKPTASSTTGKRG